MDAPNATLTWEAPTAPYPIVDVKFRDPSGTTSRLRRGVELTEDGITFSAPVTAGDHILVVTPIRRSGTVETAVEVPLPQLDPTITYDANDHATVIDDGITRIEESLDPSGRVIERTVTDTVTGEVTEDLLVGYAGPGDNRAYELHGNGTVVTYLGGPTGLLAVDRDGLTSWPLDDGQDSIVGTVAPDGTYEQAAIADEFGRIVGDSESGLDWLGAETRHRTGDAFGLVRMGVRLYDPALGRFLGVDPVDGGSANTYDYCNADPINCRDLTGEFSWSDLGEIVTGVAASVAVSAVVIGLCSTGVGCAAGLILGGAAVNAANGAGWKAVSGRPVTEGVVQDAAWGAVSGVVGGGGTAAVTREALEFSASGALRGSAATLAIQGTWTVGMRGGGVAVSPYPSSSRTSVVDGWMNGDFLLRARRRANPYSFWSYMS